MSFVNRFHNTHTAAVAAAGRSKLNLLVRYLDHTVDDDQLRCFFTQFGDVTSSMVMRDILTGESRGFGFVRFARHTDAVRALCESDGRKIGSKAVNVLWAKQQHDATPAGQDRLKMNKLFLRNVPLDVTEQQLADLVAPYGTVTEVSLHKDKISAACHAPSRRIAFIVFRTDGAAEAALRAIHNTRPFRSCNEIPLMAKLSEDYKAKSGTHHSSNTNTNSNVAAAASVVSRCLSVTLVDAHAQSALCRFSSEVITAPSILKHAEESCCYVSTPNSTAARSPGISSLVPSLESTSPVLMAKPGLRLVAVTELETSLHSSDLKLRTSPVRRMAVEARMYRHNPYGCARMVPATLTSSTTAVYVNSLTSRRLLYHV